jgi:hypothetical protein
MLELAPRKYSVSLVAEGAGAVLLRLVGEDWMRIVVFLTGVATVSVLLMGLLIGGLMGSLMCLLATSAAGCGKRAAVVCDCEEEGRTGSKLSWPFVD